MTQPAAVFPLGQAFLPGEFVPLRVFEKRFLQMVSDLQSTSMTLCTVLIERGSEVGGGEVRLRHGVVLDVKQIVPSGTGIHLVCRAGDVMSVSQWIDTGPYPRALFREQVVEALDVEQRSDARDHLVDLVDKWGTLVNESGLAEDVRRHALDACETLRSGLTSVHPETNVDQTLWRAMWFVARMVPCGPLDRHRLLEPASLPDRLTRLERTIDHVSEVMRFGSLE